MRTYRIYYNYRSTAPVVWALDEGTQDSEVHVQRIEVAPGVGFSSRFSTDHIEGAPSAWFEVVADLDIHGGVAYLTTPGDRSSLNPAGIERHTQHVA